MAWAARSHSVTGLIRSSVCPRAQQEYAGVRADQVMVSRRLRPCPRGHRAVDYPFESVKLEDHGFGKLMKLQRRISMTDQLHTIVVPVYNSRSTLVTLVERLAGVLTDAGLVYELVLVDDGSSDGSFEEIRRLAGVSECVRGFRLSRNFGQQAALTVGLQQSRGEFIAIIDDDLQDPPELLPDFFSRLRNGADVVYGVRRGRKEGLLRRLVFSLFYRLMALFAKIEVPIDAGDFCGMRRCVVDSMLACLEANPYLRGIRSWVGFRQEGLEYDRAARESGTSGYSLRKYISLAVAGIFSFSYVPLRISVVFGALTASVGCLYACYVVLLWFIKPFDVPGYASLIVIVTLLGGMQLVCLGVVGEYLARINDNVRRWPAGIIAEGTSGE